MSHPCGIPLGIPQPPLAALARAKTLLPLFCDAVVLLGHARRGARQAGRQGGCYSAWIRRAGCPIEAPQRGLAGRRRGAGGSGGGVSVLERHRGAPAFERDTGQQLHAPRTRVDGSRRTDRQRSGEHSPMCFPGTPFLSPRKKTSQNASTMKSHCSQLEKQPYALLTNTLEIGLWSYRTPAKRVSGSHSIAVGREVRHGGRKYRYTVYYYAINFCLDKRH